MYIYLKLPFEDLNSDLYLYTLQTFILMNWPSHQECTVVNMLISKSSLKFVMSVQHFSICG